MNLASAPRHEESARQPYAAVSVGPSEAGQIMRDKVLALVPLIRREAEAGEKLGAMTPAVVNALNEVGFFKITLPREYGGYGFGARDIAEVVGAAATGDGSTAWSGFVSVGLRNAFVFDEQTVSELMADAGSWVGPLMVGASVFSQIVGDARLVDGGFMVRGKWSFGSGCKHAKWAFVGIQWEEGGVPHRGIALLSRDQYEIVDDWHVMGLQGTSSNSITALDEVFVPTRRTMASAEMPIRLAKIRNRFEGVGYQTGAFGMMLTVTISNVAITLGMAKGCLQEFSQQANARKPFNLPYDTVAETPSTQVVAGRVNAMINAAETLIHGVADEVDRRAASGLDFEPREEALNTMNLVFAARLCADAIDMMQICLGSSTVTLKNPIQRFARDARVLISHGAIRQDPAAEIAGRHVLGLPPFKMFAGGLPQK
ncbi:acyl-CoA dehydrogenase family protein [Agrobacterium vitis]|uniref:Acyl-CoA dehydrogenase family protein n=1 Tax=Agrobacterium vitis TaxID=373 RepID=A0AAE2RAC1_AGRVI|nr:acyl-CoA dehydrogenase family protein [Agrobacterium vitis]MBF2713969.1 acyl-CoA dehydrogenase family protein [Agrobacterium vitis]MUZ62052.1 oxidoreductase [Agrobacterium vitis]MVA20453.1 oxidoreductase [Agrobacterium vitis]MVA60276.1 oxidoreductase [Agrobacterium vitis]NSZ18410.1 oxidoreductase [Agrobacterium vitis]